MSLFSQPYFYFASLRKINAVFGNIFNNIRIQRVDEDSNVVKTFKVPLEQAQKQSYLARLNEEAKKKGSPGIGITLPRMSYEFVGMSYNPAEKLQSTRYMRQDKTDNDNTARKMFNPVPYTVNIDLSLYSKTFDDALQILEQILPFFGPHIGLTINEVPEMGLKNDITIQIDGFDTSTEYEGHIGTDRIIQWTLNFSIKTRLYLPITDPKIIKRTIENIHASHSDEDYIHQIITQEVNPFTADLSDVYTIDKTIEEF